MPIRWPWEPNKCDHVLVYYQQDPDREWLKLLRCKSCNALVAWSVPESHKNDPVIQGEVTQLTEEEKKDLA